MIGRSSARRGVLVGAWTHRFAPVVVALRGARRVVFRSCPMPAARASIHGMHDFQLYQQILGLVEPWRVERVTLKAKEQEMEVRVGFADTLWGYPQCQKRMEIHDA